MKKLTQKEVRSWLVSLAQSQGFYGRLLRDFNNTEAYVRRNFMSALHENKVKDMFDFVMYIEG
ncbi:MAG: hypothetical protein J6R59_01205 [Paludibacteraceae bacterium]|nr:hypothetical protein [Paludibacteraceae bacterium]